MKSVRQWLLWVGLAGLSLQLFFLLRIVLMLVLNPESTSFERSEAWQVWTAPNPGGWQQRWVPYAQMSDHIKRAVIASEDGDFIHHRGVEWTAIQQAWQRNAQAEAKVAKRTQQLRPGQTPPPTKIVGGSTITQQLAKNLLLSGERTWVRKVQELALTMMLEAVLSKRRILEIYLNHVEWGRGVFGIEAAAQHYYRKPATRLTPYEAARLAVMLPRPKFFEQAPNSSYLSQRANTIVARMGDAQLP
jgi:monofunctional biosynthetic peptidoglycan transglycosylase